MGLFGPKWMSNDPQKALDAIEKESSSDKLRQAAEKAPVAKVRLRAAIRLNDQDTYRKLAVSDPNWEVRDHCAYQVTDQQLLMRIAGQDESAEVRKSALLKITDETYKILYAQKINHPDLARVAADGVKSERGLALLAATCDKDAIVKKALASLSKLPKLNEETLGLLRQSKNSAVREFLRPYADEPTRIREIKNETDGKKRADLIRTLENKNELYRLAVEDESSRCRNSAYDRLVELRKKSKINNDWWTAHIDEGTRDQRLAMLMKKSLTDESAAREIARQQVGGGFGYNDSEYVVSHMTMPVLEQLEQYLRDGDKTAEKVLFNLYKGNSREKLNPALAEYAAAQEGRAYQVHKDGMVDSDVCGETFRHDDRMTGAFMKPLP